MNNGLALCFPFVSVLALNMGVWYSDLAATRQLYDDTWDKTVELILTFQCKLLGTKLILLKTVNKGGNFPSFHM